MRAQPVQNALTRALGLKWGARAALFLALAGVSVGAAAQIADPFQEAGLRAQDSGLTVEDVFVDDYTGKALFRLPLPPVYRLESGYAYPLSLVWHSQGWEVRDIRYQNPDGSLGALTHEANPRVQSLGLGGVLSPGVLDFEQPAFVNGHGEVMPLYWTDTIDGNELRGLHDPKLRVTRMAGNTGWRLDDGAGNKLFFEYSCLADPTEDTNACRVRLLRAEDLYGDSIVFRYSTEPQTRLTSVEGPYGKVEFSYIDSVGSRNYSVGLISRIDFTPIGSGAAFHWTLAYELRNLSMGDLAPGVTFAAPVARFVELGAPDVRYELDYDGAGMLARLRNPLGGVVTLDRTLVLVPSRLASVKVWSDGVKDFSDRVGKNYSKLLPKLPSEDGFAFANSGWSEAIAQAQANYMKATALINNFYAECTKTAQDECGPGSGSGCHTEEDCDAATQELFDALDELYAAQIASIMESAMLETVVSGGSTEPRTYEASYFANHFVTRMTHTDPVSGNTRTVTWARENDFVQRPFRVTRTDSKGVTEVTEYFSAGRSNNTAGSQPTLFERILSAAGMKRATFLYGPGNVLLADQFFEYQSDAYPRMRGNRKFQDANTRNLRVVSELRRRYEGGSAISSLLTNRWGYDGFGHFAYERVYDSLSGLFQESATEFDPDPTAWILDKWVSKKSRQSDEVAARESRAMFDCLGRMREFTAVDPVHVGESVCEQYAFGPKGQLVERTVGRCTPALSQAAQHAQTNPKRLNPDDAVIVNPDGEATIFLDCTISNEGGTPSSDCDQGPVGGGGGGDTCGSAFPDPDGDGVRGSCDNCPDEANANQLDTDHDGVGNVCDNCPAISNVSQADEDGDGAGNACDASPCDGLPSGCLTDSDGDTVPNYRDNCSGVSNANQADQDFDGYGDSCDNCVQFYNPDQTDTDSDNEGDACEPLNQTQDSDGDGVVNASDNCEFVQNATQADGDGNDVGDACEFAECAFTTADLSVFTAEVTVNFTWQFGLPVASQTVGLAYENVRRTVDPFRGFVLTETSPNGISVAYQYDVVGRMTSVTPDSPEIPTLVSYPTPNRRIQERGLAGGNGYLKTVEDFDGFGRFIRGERLNEQGNAVEQIVEFDAFGRPVFQGEWRPVGSAAHVGTATVFDILDRPVTVTAADGAVTSFAYFGDHKASTSVSVQTPTGVQTSTTTTYTDGFGRTLLVDAPEGADAVYRHDGLGSLVKVNLTDANVGGLADPLAAWRGNSIADHQVRSFLFDALGRLREAQNPENGLVKYLSYDALSNPLNIEDENGRAAGYTLAYAYDSAKRPLSVTRKNGNGTTRLISQLYYDEDHTAGLDVANKFKSKLTTMRTIQPNPSSCNTNAVYEMTRTFLYNGLNGRLGHTDTHYRFEEPSQSNATQCIARDVAATLDYSHDSLGQLTNLLFSQENGGRVTSASHQFFYAHGFEIQQNSTVNGESHTYIPEIHYNDAGGISTLAFGNGTLNTITPDVRFRPSRITATNPGQGTTLFDTGIYQFDGAGNITAMGADTFRYDKISRLVEASVTRGSMANPGQQHQFGYAFDIFGNMTNRSLTNAGSIFTGSFLEEANNPYLADVTIANRSYQTTQNGHPFYDNRVHDKTGGQEIFQYDGNGNTLRDEEHQYVWDELNRLIEVRTLDGASRLMRAVYDTDNERVMKIEYNPAAGVTSAASTYWRDEAGMVQFEGTEQRGPDPNNEGSEFSSTTYKAYGYALGKVAYELSFNENLNSGGLEPYGGCEIPTLGQTAFITRSNGYDAIVPIEASCEDEGTVALTVTLYEQKHEDGGASTTNDAWEEREKYTVAVSQDDPIPTSVLFPHLLYDRSYRTVLRVETTHNTLGGFGGTMLVGGESTWNVPKDERKSYVAAVRDGRDGNITLWWEPAADTYNVYRVGGSGARVLLTGEPLNQPGVNFDAEAAELAGLSLGDLFQVEDGGGTSILGGTPNPNAIGPPGGGGGGPAPACEITCTPSGCTITGGKGCALPPRSAVSALYMHVDHLGTPRATSDANGVLKTTEDLEAFGLSIPGFDANSYTHRFTGHERDAQVGLDMMHLRYYGPSGARFLSVDRAGDGWNWYVYASDSPLRYVDPTGEQASAFAESAVTQVDKLEGGTEDLLFTEKGGLYGTVRNTLATTTTAFTTKPAFNLARSVFEPLTTGDGLGEALGEKASLLKVAWEGYKDDLRAKSLALALLRFA